MNSDLLKKYKKYIDTFGMNEKELVVFLYNYYDSYAFNDYLTNDYLEFDFNSDEFLLKLVNFFEKNNVNKEQAKEILISSPVILSCKNPEKDLNIICKDDNIEGIVVYDSEGDYHLYRKKSNSLRSIMQNSSFLEDLDVDENNKLKLDVKKYNKKFYVKNNCKID